MINKDLIRQLETTDEYNAWQETLFAIIGYASNEENDDEDLIMELMADHLYASFKLQDGLDKANYKVKKELHDEWAMDNSGE